VPIIFKARAVGIAGSCTTWSDGYKEIQIDPTYWDEMDRTYKLELLAHEVGHCDYGLDHNDGRFIDKDYLDCPTSIMNSYNFGGDCFTKHFNTYMEEFNG
jgi:hypothetical protein